MPATPEPEPDPFIEAMLVVEQILADASARVRSAIQLHEFRKATPASPPAGYPHHGRHDDFILETMVDLLRRGGPTSPRDLFVRVRALHPGYSISRWQIIDRLRYRPDLFEHLGHAQWGLQTITPEELRDVYMKHHPRSGADEAPTPADSGSTPPAGEP
jgi:hypothetical protein